MPPVEIVNGSAKMAAPVVVGELTLTLNSDVLPVATPVNVGATGVQLPTVSQSPLPPLQV